MEQFSLEKWLQDKSRKVVTRDGREVEIFYSNVNKTLLIGRISDTEIHQYTKDGFQCDTINQAKNDLFFADEEEELTEFETRIYNLINFSDPDNNPSIKEVKEETEILLDLARKELEKDIEHSAVEFAKFYMEDVNPSFEKVQESEELWKWKMSCLKGVNKAYTNGKQDALKDLADWKNRNSKGLWDAEKVCKFLYEKVIDITYFNKDNTNEHYDKDEFIDDLRKAMEADE